MAQMLEVESASERAHARCDGSHREVNKWAGPRAPPLAEVFPGTPTSVSIFNTGIEAK